jgi:hypothetical protein
MLEFTAPDGSKPGFMYSTAALGITLPPGQTAALYATSDADWEVAVLVYLQGYRLHDDLGNYGRRVTLLVYAQEYPQQLMFTGRIRAALAVARHLGIPLRRMEAHFSGGRAV